MKKILLVEDDENLRRGISFTLEQDGYGVITYDRVSGAAELIHAESPDLLILDVNLPDGSGMELCKEIRKTYTAPIFFLTALDMETDVVSGLSVGADDYLTKPFSLAILKAKIAASLRRFEVYTTTLSVPPFILDADRHTLHKLDQEIQLSSTEYRIAHYFMKNAGIVLEKEQILNVLWDDQGKFIDENTLSVNIHRLRQKIEDDPQTPLFIQTVRGIGYIWKRRG